MGRCYLRTSFLSTCFHEKCFFKGNKTNVVFKTGGIKTTFVVSIEQSLYTCFTAHAKLYQVLIENLELVFFPPTEKRRPAPSTPSPDPKPQNVVQAPSHGKFFSCKVRFNIKRATLEMIFTMKLQVFNFSLQD